MPGAKEQIFVGLDLGTSGCRACAVDGDMQTLAEARRSWRPPRATNGRSEEPDPERWWQAVAEVLGEIVDALHGRRVSGLAVDGTSATMLAVTARGEPVGPALMYNDRRATAAAEQVARVAPPASACHGPSAGLAKLLYLRGSGLPEGTRVLSQADWITGRLLGRPGVSDANNSLKLGFDPRSGDWPDWLQGLGLTASDLPEVYAPGTQIGEMDRAVARSLAWPDGTKIVAGSTDSVAATLASGVSEAGEAVTALGSTLVLKIVTPRAVFSPAHGVYSHRVGGMWLAGGASNSGGAVLSRYFSPKRLTELSVGLMPEHPTGLDFYPLPGRGERFPVNDPTLEPCLEPRPSDDRIFLQAMLEAMAEIEHRGYDLLAQLGAPAPVSVRSTGGGAANEGWRRIRERILGVPILAARWSEACYGAALLARHGCGAGPLLAA